MKRNLFDRLHKEVKIRLIELAPHSSDCSALVRTLMTFTSPFNLFASERSRLELLSLELCDISHAFKRE